MNLTDIGLTSKFGIGPKSPEAREKAYQEIKKAYDLFVKKNKRKPNISELMKTAQVGRRAAESAVKKFNLKMLTTPGFFSEEAFTKGRKTATETFRAKKIEEPKSLKRFDKRLGVRFPDKTVENNFIKDLRKLYKYPFQSVDARKAGVMSVNDFLKKYYKAGTSEAKVKEHLSLMANKLKLKYPKQTLSAQAAIDRKLKERRTQAIDITSSRSIESKIRNLKAGEKGIDLAHRASLHELKRLGQPGNFILLAKSF